MRNEELAEVLIKRLTEASQTLVLAESCTAGLAADLLACVPGASKVLWGSYICYTAEAKAVMLGLDRKRMEQYGLVSREIACDMALSALEKSGAFIACAITGIAGPDGDGSSVPVGTVYIATVMQKEAPTVMLYSFTGTRNEIRFQSAQAALQEILKTLDNKGKIC